MPEPITPKISKAICSFDACDRPCCARGLCASHDLQRRRGRTLTPLRPSRLTPKIHKATCSFDACGRSSQAKGLCSSHHAQRMRGRTLTQLRPLRWANTPLMPYLWSRIDKNGPVPEYAPELGPCWLWLGGRHSCGYGKSTFNKKQLLVHRLTYEESNGAIPADLELDHLCRVRHCCRPSHLEVVTHEVNAQRGMSPAAQNARKTACPKGHPYSVQPNGYRICRPCFNDHQREARAIRSLTLKIQPLS